MSGPTGLLAHPRAAAVLVAATSRAMRSVRADVALTRNRVISPAFQDRYWSRPAAFAYDAIDWPDGQHPALYQLDALDALIEYGRVAERGPRGLGKTTGEALAILWYACTRDGRDWKIPTTAGSWGQLTRYLWPEVRKWARRLRWDVLGRAPLDEGRELQVLALKLRTGEAFAVASNRPDLIEGAHADYLLYIFDEAKSIPVSSWDAIEGTFANAGADVSGEAYALAASTPGEPVGRFYDIHTRRPGYEDWHSIHVRKEDAIAAGRLSAAWAEQRRRQWGEREALYQNQVEGEFAASDEAGIIPSSWVEDAFERWREWDAAGRPDPGRLTRIGVDVARSGKDRTVLALRFGQRVSELRRYGRQGTMATTGYVAGVLDAHERRTWPDDERPVAVVDVIGIGAGVVDRLRELGYRTAAFNAASRSTLLDRTGELRFINSRAAAWWCMRELLNPDTGAGVGLPPDDELLGELVAPRWQMTSSGIKVERKADVIDRLGRSTDSADAVVQAFAPIDGGMFVELGDELLAELGSFRGV